MTSQSTSCEVDDMKRTEPERLFEENTRLAHSVLWKNYPAFAADEDLHQEALLGLWRACLTYDPKRSQFPTYAYTCILNQVRMAMRNQAKQPPTVSLETPIPEQDGLTLEGTLEELVPSLDDGFIDLKDFLRELSPRDQLLVQCRLEGLSQKQTAERLGLTQPYCSRLLTKIYVDYTKRRGEDE